MDDLIKRLKAATGPDRKLDAEVDARLHGGVPSHLADADWKRSYSAGFIHGDASGLTHPRSRHAKRLTESIDDAVTIIPKGMKGHVGICGNKVTGLYMGKEPSISTSHVVSAIAVTIVALEARKRIGTP